ncbi:leucine-rich repeat-containing protein 23 [Bombyx mori]|uniref:Leucine-rich repeat-containing protein 23 n=1 Tax=Bombyx mori TaxID=7091 RepID=A0A8R2C9D0_BOMMO|nr:leucine-rich repeat-containing protein 23 [Bombyx mori]
MLKSHFDIHKDDDVEEEFEHEAVSHAHEEEEEHALPEVISGPVRKLNRSEVSVRLGLLGKTAEADGYTYLKATCTDMNLTDITAIKYFKHLQFVDVSNNKLDLEALQAVTELPHLLLIHADKNILRSGALKKMKYLQVIIMNYNELTTVHDVFQPELSTLEVGYNKIRKINFDSRMETIRCLDFRYNLIEDINGLNFPNLDSLYLAGNQINSLIGLESCVNLRILHVRNNPIKLLNGFVPDLGRLQYVNLRNCKVSTLRQVKKLKVLPSLETLILKGCPYMGGTGEETPEVADEEENSELRVEILAALPKLKKINKTVVTPEERAEAKELITQWIEDGAADEEAEEEQQPEEHDNDDD